MSNNVTPKTSAERDARSGRFILTPEEKQAITATIEDLKQVSRRITEIRRQGRKA